MSSFNKVILMGNLTRDPHLKQLPSQSQVCEFGLAVNRRYRSADGEDREETLFIDCSAFGKQADVLHQYCKKGKPLFIEGRLKFDSWEDKQSGATRSRLSVIVENFQFVGSRDGSGSFPGAAANADAQTVAKSSPDRSPVPSAASRPDAPGKPRGKRPAEQLKFKEADIPF